MEKIELPFMDFLRYLYELVIEFGKQGWILECNDIHFVAVARSLYLYIDITQCILKANPNSYPVVLSMENIILN